LDGESQEEAAMPQEEIKNTPKPAMTKDEPKKAPKPPMTQEDIRNALKNPYSMTEEDWKDQALYRIPASLNITDLRGGHVYHAFLDGVLVTVTYNDEDKQSKPTWSYVHFRDSESRFYLTSSEVLNTVDTYKERIWFFRFLEFAGTGGFIASMLILIFSVLLCLLALTTSEAKTQIVDVVKVSFTIILGYFFGQASGKK
jgi:hypothetical protein